MTIPKDWHHKNLYFKWPLKEKLRFKKGYQELQQELAEKLANTCTHLKGNGGVKGSVKWAYNNKEKFSFCARFDIASYYESMDLPILLDILKDFEISQSLYSLVSDYIYLGGMKTSSKGLICGGSLSPLLAAVYLSPLDQLMEKLTKKKTVGYSRYMDDFVIFATSRWVLKRAIKKMHRVLDKLKLVLHQKKRFIGRTNKGFDFLGYTIAAKKKLRPSATSLKRVMVRFNRLYEQKKCACTLWFYLTRWYRWLRGGLGGLVALKGGPRRYFYYIIKRLKIKGLACPNGSLKHKLL